MLAALLMAQLSQTSTVDSILSDYRARTSAVVVEKTRCSQGDNADGAEILVCGRNDRSVRLPLPDERVPPEVAPHGSLLVAPIFVFKVIRKIVDPDR